MRSNSTGVRLQAHKLSAGVRLFSKNAKILPTAFPRSPRPSCDYQQRLAIEGELVACDVTDRPDFYALAGAVLLARFCSLLPRSPRERCPHTRVAAP